MDVLKQPHDKFFRSTFGKVEVASDFLNNYLPKDLVEIIDMNTLEPQKESFLDSKLREEFSDLLFKVNINNEEAYIYFLFEHKSYKDKMVIFQVLKYMVSIWESKIQEDKDRRKKEGKVNSGEIELPIILPLVVYHDEGKWSIKRTLGEMLSNYKELPDSLKKYIPDFEYLLFDLSEFTKDEVKLQSETMISIKALSRTRHASRAEAIDILVEAIELINEAEEKDQIVYYVSACIRYMLSVRNDITEKDMKRIAEKISIEGGELVMSVAERLRQEGLEEGKEKGIQEGELIRARKSARIGIIKGYSTKEIADITDLTEKEIEEIRKQMLN